MKILFVDFDTYEEHTVDDRAECKTETERMLWDMHGEVQSTGWKLGRTLALRLDLKLERKKS